LAFSLNSTVIVFISPPSNQLANWHNPTTPLGGFARWSFFGAFAQVLSHFPFIAIQSTIFTCKNVRMWMYTINDLATAAAVAAPAATTVLSWANSGSEIQSINR